MAELDELLREVSASDPCGADLTYDEDFLALESAARGKPEQQFGDTVIAAEPPDWRAVEKRATELFSRTKDIRVAVLLSRAWVNRQGLTGMASGLELVCGLLERYWEPLHPMAEDGDFFMRMNAVTSLNEITGLLRELRQAEFLRSSAGTVSVREAEALVRGVTLETPHKMSLDQLRATVQDSGSQPHPVPLTFETLRGALERIDSLCMSNLSGSQRPELNHLQSLIAALSELMPSKAPAAISGLSPAPDTAPGQEPIFSTSPGAPIPVPVQAGALRHREDAIERLMEVVAFLEKTEPTNPAPLLIRRAVKLMRMGFMDILRELSPDSLSQVENIMVGRDSS